MGGTKMPLPNDGRKGCVSFEERVMKLIATNQVNSEEYKTWMSLFGSQKMKDISSKFETIKVSFQKKGPEEVLPDEEGWILVHPDEFEVVRTDDILEYGSTLPGGSIYLKLKSAVHDMAPQLA